jgi:hypothetical protein|mmetsp:Transcript_19650/g.32871  ORF Transcript_19650/g.32871 Transcript_19650/m.32871 type:complete len:93 (-) Transcript_19650:930-1208(-)
MQWRIQVSECARLWKIFHTSPAQSKKIDTYGPPPVKGSFQTLPTTTQNPNLSNSTKAAPLNVEAMVRNINGRSEKKPTVTDASHKNKGSIAA